MTEVLSLLVETQAEEIVVGSQTLAVGAPAITVGGTAMSMQSDGESVVVDGVVEDVRIILTMNGLGGIIVSLGGFAMPTPTPTPVSTTSSSAEFNRIYVRARSRRLFDIWLLGPGVGIGTLGVIVSALMICAAYDAPCV